MPDEESDSSIETQKQIDEVDNANYRSSEKSASEISMEDDQGINDEFEDSGSINKLNRFSDILTKGVSERNSKVTSSSHFSDGSNPFGLSKLSHTMSLKEDWSLVDCEIEEFDDQSSQMMSSARLKPDIIHEFKTKNDVNLKNSRLRPLTSNLKT